MSDGQSGEVYLMVRKIPDDTAADVAKEYSNSMRVRRY
jgi:hypothetical protein